MKYQLSLLAERDLADIAQSTRQRWGAAQVQQYGLLLENALQQLANNSLMEKPRPELYEEARSFSVEAHIIFYRPTPSGIDVARVLHRHMDIPTQF